MPDNSDQDLADRTFDRYEQYLNPGMASLVKFMGLENVEVEAQGCYVTLDDGTTMLDCFGGPGVFTAGHRNPTIVDEVVSQAQAMPLSSHVLLNPVAAELGEKLAAITPGDLQYSFFCNSGAEAVEGGLKAARAYTGRAKFVAAQGAFHGKTFGALSASGRDVYKDPFKPLMDGFTHVAFGDSDAMEKAVDDETAAVIIEPIQCEAGIRIPPDGYLSDIRSICDAHDALLIVDEIQTGLGRTGRMFGCEWDEVAPDIMTVGKAIGGGVMPLAAFIARPAIWQMFDENPYIHSSTFGGNPVACRAGIAAIDVIMDEDLAAKASARGGQLLEGVTDLADSYPELICDTRGRGLLVAIEFPDRDIGGLVIAGLVGHDILSAYALNNPEVLRLEPPAIITEDEIDRVIEALDAVCEHTGEMVAMAEQ